MGLEMFVVAGLTVKPGARATHRIKLLELPDGSDVKFPLLVVNGAKTGPTLYLGAAIHGDEVGGIEVVSQALTSVDPADLSGRIICIPVQNPLAFYADHRFAISFFLKSPMEQSPLDPWACMPGKADGNLTQMIAHKIFSLVKQCDYAIDVHTPTRGGRYIPIAILPPASLGKAASRAAEMAEAFGSGYIMATDEGMYVADGILSVEATRTGIPAFTFELGEGGRLEADVVAAGVNCILNILRNLGMVAGQPNAPARRFHMKKFVNIRASRGGLLYTVAPLGEPVRQGDVVARTVSVFGEDVEKFRSPIDGVFIRATTLSTVAEGERVASIGLLS